MFHTIKQGCYQQSKILHFCDYFKKHQAKSYFQQNQTTENQKCYKYVERRIYQPSKQDKMFPYYKNNNQKAQIPKDN